MYGLAGKRGRTPGAGRERGNAENRETRKNYWGHVQHTPKQSAELPAVFRASRVAVLRWTPAFAGVTTNETGAPSWCARPTCLPPCPAAPRPRLFVGGRLVEVRLDRRDDRLVGVPDDRHHDAVMDRVHFDDLHVERLAFLDRVGRVVDVRDAELATSGRSPRCRCRGRRRRPCPSGARRGRGARCRPAASRRCVSHGSSSACLRPREIRLFSPSMLRITTSTASPFLTTSDGCWTRLVQDMSEMWIRPSMPGSISTKAPKLVRLRTLP